MIIVATAKRRTAIWTVALVLGLAWLGVSLMIARGDGRMSPTATWEEAFEGALRSGDKTDTLRAVVFMDYECVYCRALEALFASWRSDGHDVTVGYRFMTSRTYKPHGHAGARAAICAAAQTGGGG